MKTNIEHQLEELTDETFLDRATMSPFDQPPRHPNCWSTMQLTYRMPTIAEMKQEILALLVKRHLTPRRRLWRRLTLQMEIDTKLAIALAMTKAERLDK